MQSKEEVMSKYHDHVPQDTDGPWRLDLDVTDDGDESVATVELVVANAIYESHGRARRDPLVPKVARELAVAYALSGLSHQLVAAASRDVNDAAKAVTSYRQQVDEA